VATISSRQNATVKRFRALARESTGDELLLEGAHLVEEGLAAGLTFDTVAFAESSANGKLAPLVSRAEHTGARVLIVADAVFPGLSPVTHPTGVVAIAQLGKWTLDAVLAKQPQLVMMVDAVQDPGNVGAIVRAAEACGVSGVIVGSGSADPFGWKALRGSMGSALRLPIARVDSTTDAVDAARAAGMRVFAAVPRGGTRLADCDMRGPTAIILGGEGPGLSADVLERADQRLTIPMQAPVESLNVAVAAAIVLYEAARQRTDVAV
jgi:TrmH family RNA methyltransferase